MSAHSRHTQSGPLNLFHDICISGRIFENAPQRPQKGQEYSHRNLAKARFLVTVARIYILGLAVLVGLIVKLSP